MKVKKKQRSIDFATVAILAVCAILVIGGVVLAIINPGANSPTNKTDNSNDDPIKDISTEVKYNPPALDEDKTYFADIVVKDYGKITVKLDQKSAPITAANFVDLAKKGFYNNLTFHRIIEDFMMQGGDPNGNGTGGSENSILGEFSANGVNNPLKHTRGTISMGRRGNDYNSASSQFFIVHKDYPSLNGKYAAFGNVTEGMDVVDAICKDAKPSDDNGTIPQKMQPVIESITIREE
ncbi:MAG: peptidylprolyl isomerase [Clostridia bacterium]|nr:peptidylprolyl isomerase [Clostridia bacterium]